MCTPISSSLEPLPWLVIAGTGLASTILFLVYQSMRSWAPAFWRERTALRGNLTRLYAARSVNIFRPFALACALAAVGGLLTQLESQSRCAEYGYVAVGVILFSFVPIIFGISELIAPSGLQRLPNWAKEIQEEVDEW